MIDVESNDEYESANKSLKDVQFRRQCRKYKFSQSIRKRTNANAR